MTGRRRRPVTSRSGCWTTCSTRGWCQQEDVAMALSLQLNLPIIDLKRHAVQPEALSLVPEEYARQHDLIPIDVVDDALVVVMADPTNIQVLEDLKTQARKVIQPTVGIPSDIREAIESQLPDQRRDRGADEPGGPCGGGRSGGRRGAHGRPRRPDPHRPDPGPPHRPGGARPGVRHPPGARRR